jgi:hypothetical protein
MTDDPMKLLEEARDALLAYSVGDRALPIISRIDRYIATGGWTEVTGFIPPEIEKEGK